MKCFAILFSWIGSLLNGSVSGGIVDFMLSLNHEKLSNEQTFQPYLLILPTVWNITYCLTN